jgi:type II secretory pathway pseudopilin PulG
MKKYYRAQEYAKLYHAQAGMTLIELTVVLLILIGLAGLLIPYVGSFVQKTHDSTNSSNLASLNNAFLRYTAENNMLPQHMDTLVNGTTVVGTGVCPAVTVPNDPYCALLDAGVFTKATYAANSIAINSIVGSKIRMVVNNKTNAANKTFGSYEDMIGLTNPAVATFNGIKVGAMRDAAGAAIAAPTDAQIQAHLAAALGKDPMDYDPGCYDYVAFGLGDANGLVTKTIASSPVHYPEDATKGPVDYYNHYIAIVQVDKSNTAADSTNAMMGGKCTSVTEPAKFLGAVMNVPGYPGSKLFGVNASLGYAYENQLAGK